jgi:hypothetical protein
MARAYHVSAQLKTSDGETTLNKFAGSQGDAAAAKRDMLEAHKDGGLKRADVQVEEIDIPTDKKGLIVWLNKTFC